MRKKNGSNNHTDQLVAHTVMEIIQMTVINFLNLIQEEETVQPHTIIGF
jgi:hypothetical protein